MKEAPQKGAFFVGVNNYIKLLNIFIVFVGSSKIAFSKI